MLGILFLLPIPLGANRPWAWSIFEIAIFVLTAFVIVKYWKVDKFGLSAYLSLVYMWIAFIILCTLQIIPLPDFVVALFSPTSLELFNSVHAPSFYISVDPGQSLVSFIKLLSFFCLFICILLLVNSEKRIRHLLLTFVASGTFQALYGSLEILLNRKTSLVFGVPIESVATGTFVYQNHYANFLLLCISAGIGLLVASLEKEKINNSKDFLRSFITALLSNKAVVRICIAIMVIGIVMSRSRMGNTSMFVAMAVVAAVALVLIKNRSKGLSLLIISMFIIDLFIVSAYFGLERVKERLTQTTFSQETRDEVIKDAYPIVADFPLFGSGAGTFYSTFPSYQVAEVNAFYDHAHNDYLQFLIEYGVLGIFLLTAMFLFCTYKSMRAMYRKQNSIFKGSSFACLMVFVGMAMHMTVDFPLQAYSNASYFVVFLALSMVINQLKLNKSRIESTSNTF